MDEQKQFLIEIGDIFAGRLVCEVLGKQGLKIFYLKLYLGQIVEILSFTIFRTKNMDIVWINSDHVMFLRQ